MPFLAAIPAVIGLVESIKQQGNQNKAFNTQTQIAQQEMKDKQQIFDLLKPFFQQYMQQGSPFLSMIQRAGAEQNAQQFGNAAGQLRNTMQTSGLGFGPSGATAAALGGLGTEAARNASSTFLQNLLNNENLKFQAAQGLRDVGSMAGASQNQPNVGVNLPAYNSGSSATGLSQILQGLLKGGGGFDFGTAGNAPNIPSPNIGPVNAPDIPFPIPGLGSSIPTVGGVGLGPNF